MFAILVISTVLSILVLNCLDIKAREGYEELVNLKVYNSELNSTRIEVFA